MEVLFAQQPFPTKVTKTLFLAGPSPRSQGVGSWRREALRILEQLGYDGTVFVPENWEQPSFDFLPQVDWENEALHRADQIVFWIPRDLTDLPGFTTNHEHGEWFQSGKVVLGVPPDAPKTRYLIAKARAAGDVLVCMTLEETLLAALLRVGTGATRLDGECAVPLLVWRTASFQAWYRAQRRAGNRLDDARVVWTFRVGPQRFRMFLWVLHADVYVAAEQRHKRNEVVIGRPDIASTVLYRRGKSLLDSTVVLVREFRSAARTDDGFIHEPPGGSSWDAARPMRDIALGETEQETGFRPAAHGIAAHATRQCAGTILSHAAHVFSYELTDAELSAVRAQTATPHPQDDDEHTVVEIRTVRELLASSDADWSTVGMVLSVLVPFFS